MFSFDFLYLCLYGLLGLFLIALYQCIFSEIDYYFDKMIIKKIKHNDLGCVIIDVDNKMYICNSVEWEKVVEGKRYDIDIKKQTESPYLLVDKIKYSTTNE